MRTLIRAKNPSGDQSDPFSFIVQAEAGGNAPHIDSVSPTSVIHSANLQVFAVTGANFSSALSVTLLDPSGQPLSVNGAIVGTVLPESFQIGVTLTQTGTYTLTSRTRRARRPIPWQLPCSDDSPPRSSTHGHTAHSSDSRRSEHDDLRDGDARQRGAPDDRAVAIFGGYWVYQASITGCTTA